MKRCRVCGEPGHNRQTCGLTPEERRARRKAGRAEAFKRWRAANPDKRAARRKAERRRRRERDPAYREREQAQLAILNATPLEVRREQARRYRERHREEIRRRDRLRKRAFWPEVTAQPRQRLGAMAEGAPMVTQRRDDRTGRMWFVGLSIVGRQWRRLSDWREDAAQDAALRELERRVP